MPKRTKLTARQKETLFLADIVSEASNINLFTRGKNFVTFSTDILILRASTKCLESIGEATKNLSEALKKRHPQIEWKKVTGFRDFSAHHYWEINPAIIWDIIEGHLPAIIAAANDELSRRTPPPTIP